MYYPFFCSAYVSQENTNRHQVLDIVFCIVPPVIEVTCKGHFLINKVWVYASFQSLIFFFYLFESVNFDVAALT